MGTESIEASFLSIFALISFFIFLVVSKYSHKIRRGALLDKDLINRDMLVVSIATLLFAIFIFLQNKHPFKNLKVIKFGGFLFVLGYFVYILFLANVF